MAIKPILFNGHMVRAILDGRKTVTRRVVKPQPVSKLAYCMAGYKHGTWGYPGDDVWKDWGYAYKRDTPIPENERSRNWTPPYLTGDVLWVRETWSVKIGEQSYEYIYRATDSLTPYGGKWSPSIHMPRDAARIWLRVTNVRVERLQDIDEAGAKAEGGKVRIWKCSPSRTAREDFALIWDGTINPTDCNRYGWEANPWVWVIEFERCEKPEKCDDYGRF